MSALIDNFMIWLIFSALRLFSYEWYIDNPVRIIPECSSFEELQED